MKEKYLTLQSQLVAFKKARDQEKEDNLTKQAQELEELRKHMKQLQDAELERKQIGSIKDQLA